MTVCSNHPIHDVACNQSLDDHVQMISDLLPQGRAWPRDEDSTLMRYWKAFAEVVRYAESRLCAMADEFFCTTFNETTEIWAEQYLGPSPRSDFSGTPEVCLKPGAKTATDYNSLVCAKMAEQGGSECGFFTDYAFALGWVISCEDISDQEGMAHHWRVTVDIPSSVLLQANRSPLAQMFSPAGCGYAGDSCAPLRGAGVRALWDALGEVMPAHTVLVRSEIWEFSPPPDPTEDAVIVTPADGGAEVQSAPSLPTPSITSVGDETVTLE